CHGVAARGRPGGCYRLTTVDMSDAMTPRSSRVRRRPAGGRWSAVAIVLAALVGAWSSHLVEYGRVAGVDAGLRSIGASVHISLLPAGLGLLAAVAAAGALAALAWSRLARRLADARRLMRARRNGQAGE